MKSFAAVIQRLRAKRPTRPAKTLDPAARRTTSPVSPNRLKTPSTRKHNAMQNFARSPLATPAALTAAQVDALDLVFSNDRVQHVAGQLHLKQARLLEVAGFRGAIAQAIAAVDEPASITPEKVVAILDRMAAGVDDEIAAVREDRAQHDARHKARLERLMPLRRAVATRVVALCNEREHCLTRIDALRRAATMTGGATLRHAALTSMGLTVEQIAALGPAAADPAEQEAAIRARIAAIEVELVPLKTFTANEVDVTPLAGLGFEALIEARNAAEQVPA
jgi:hypothetical protein